MTDLTVERSSKVSVVPEQAWSLVSSPAVWLLRPGPQSFAVDLPPTAHGRRLRLGTGAAS